MVSRIKYQRQPNFTQIEGILIQLDELDECWRKSIMHQLHSLSFKTRVYALPCVLNLCLMEPWIQ